MDEKKEICYMNNSFEFTQDQIKTNPRMYRVILEKVSFGIFSIILISKEEKNFTMKSKDKVLSFSKFL